MTYYSFEDQRFEEYEEYLIDYYDDGRQDYQEPSYEYYYPRPTTYNTPPLTQYKEKYDLSQGDFYSGNYISQSSENRGVGYNQYGNVEETAYRQYENDVTTTIEDTTSASTPIIPRFLYRNPLATKRVKRRRPIKSVKSKRMISKRFDEKTLGKVEELEELSTSRRKVAQETSKLPEPVKSIEQPSGLQSKFKVHIPEDEGKMSSNNEKNIADPVRSKYYSLGNFKSTEKVSDEMIAWKGKSMPDTSVESSSMCLDTTTNDLKQSSMSTDCTCITIDSEEYKEFVKQINKIPQMKITQQTSGVTENIVRSESAPPIQIGALLKTVYDANNNGLKLDDGRDLTLNGRLDFKSEPVQGKRNPLRSRKCAFKKRQTYVNPLAEVPLHSPLKVLFGFTCFNQQKQHCRKLDESPHRKKRSFFAKMFRCVITVIGCLQSFAYRYALRYILFI